MLTETQKLLARYALGLPNDRATSYRKHYAAAPGTPAHADWQVMAEQGYATKQTITPLPPNSTDIFWLTAKGAAAAIEGDEMLDSYDFPLATQTERIARAAINLDGDVISMPPPARHHDIIHKITADGENWGRCGPNTQGFLTTAGRYVDRKEGYLIAKAADQIIIKTEPQDQLFSEDLW